MFRLKVGSPFIRALIHHEEHDAFFFVPLYLYGEFFNQCGHLIALVAITQE